MATGLTCLQEPRRLRVRDLDGRTVLVTGAGHGIGRAIALAVAVAGARVALLDIDPASARGVADEITGAGGAALAIEGDVASASSRAAALAAIVGSRLGQPDILVNNAGIQVVHPFLALEADAWQRTLAVNLEGPLWLTQALSRVWVRQGVAGVVVNVASIAGRVQFPHHVAYSCSKGALRTLTAAVAFELAPHGIRVNAVAPGHVDTAMSLVAQDPGALAERVRTIPLGRVASPEEIAGVVVYLASSRASYVTGQTVTVDGGYTLQ